MRHPDGDRAGRGGRVLEPVKGHSVDVIWHHASATIELSLAVTGVPSFSVDTLRELIAFGQNLRAKLSGARHWRRVILTSSDHTVFSMGGDIASIAALAREKDTEGAAVVGELVSETLFAFASGFGLNLETVAVVNGRAFGYGFEIALACDRLVASPRATFGLPEGRFGLFAGMGATSLITRRASKAAMERLVIEGATISAAACLPLGIVDEIKEEPRGALLEEGREWGQAEWDLNQARTTIRRRAKNYTHAEIRGGLAVWETAVLSMPREDIEAAAKIARMQARRSQRR